jgi:uncharacterized protein YciI
MKYAAIFEYTSDVGKVSEHRPAHRAYLASLMAKGELAASGPFTDVPGALIVYEAASAEAVETLITADPFHAAGVFVRWQVRPWNVVLAHLVQAPPAS